MMWLNEVEERDEEGEMDTPLPQDPSLQISAIAYRLEAAERDLKQYRDQMERDLKRYGDQMQGLVSARENDLRIQSLQTDVKRVEDEVREMKRQLSDLGKQLADQERAAQQRAADQERAAQQRDAELKQSQSDLQLRFFYAVSGLVGAIIVALLIYYFTHPH